MAFLTPFASVQRQTYTISTGGHIISSPASFQPIVTEVYGIAPPVPSNTQLHNVSIPSGYVFAGYSPLPATVVKSRKQPTNQLLERLKLLHAWYKGMVSSAHGRLEYSYSPIGDPEPPICVIRDMGAVWELALLGHFLDNPELNDVIEHSLDFFCRGVIPNRELDTVIMDPEFIGEPSTIAHSAMLLLSLLWDNIRRNNKITRQVAGGILHQQRPDGSYKVHFGDEEDGPMWMYGCEALCALAEAYRWLRDATYAQSADRAMRFYDSQVFVPGFVDGQLLPFFTSWQCHACRLMFDAADDSNVWGLAPASGIQHRFADYSYRMVDRLISDGFFEDMTRSPPVTVVAVAAAVEGANDAFAMAKALLDEGRAKQYEKCIRTGLQYLLGLQATRPLGRPEKEVGGFGLTPHLRNQRVDFCGPAARAIMKTLTNNIKPLFPVV
eukprot:EG_transcript_9106